MADPNAPTLVNRIKDMMVTTTAANKTIDLASVFKGKGLTYKVETGEKTVANPTITPDGKLMLDFGALGHADIRVTATDAAGHSVSDTFRVRVAGEHAYTIAVFPDTQNYTDNAARHHIFGDMTQWLVDNKDSHKIKFMLHVGDVTQHNRSAEWDVAEAALRKLDGKIPYSILPGNHDQALGGSAADHSSIHLDKRYSAAKQKATAPGNFGGAYDQEATSGRNTYSTFTAPDGIKWLVLSMEFGPRDDVIRWASNVIEKHLDHRVIISSHALTNFAGRHNPLGSPLYDEGAGYDYGIGKDPRGANDGEAVYRKLLAKYPNISMTFSGHIFGDGAETDTSYSQYGTAVHEFLVNYQNGVSREITGNGDASKGNNGGNGAIRLIVVDPDNHRISTETYFTEFDDYLDGYRLKPKLDRDGLTGFYRGHQEVFKNQDVGAPKLFAMAKAGDDIIATAEQGQAKASVHLDASHSLNPKSESLSYSWIDENGDVIATGAKPTVELSQGKHELTLAVKDAHGVITTDKIQVFVKGDATLLQDDFNDGNLAGWGALGEAETKLIKFGTASDFNIPGITATDKVAEISPLSHGEKMRLEVKPDYKGIIETYAPSLKEYTLAYDIYVPNATMGKYVALFQTNVKNNDDGDFFIKRTGDKVGGIGINGQYHGNFTFDAWHRIAFTVNNGVVKKYIDGKLVGQQSVDVERFSLNLAKGILLFGDDDGETSKIYVSNALLAPVVYSDDDIKKMGATQAGSISKALSADAGHTSISGFVGGFMKGIRLEYDFNNNLTDSSGYSSVSLDKQVISSPFIVKGTVFSRPKGGDGLAAPQAAVYDMTDKVGNILIWKGEGSKNWSNYVYEIKLKSMDNDAIGIVFYVQDDKNYYRFTMNSETNRRELVRVKDGVETVLASTHMGYKFNTDMQIKVAIVNGVINIFMGDRNVFDGPVKDSDPLTHGTIGLYSSEQRSSIFDDVMVRKVSLEAHAGADIRLIDRDGDGHATTHLSAKTSFGLDNITSYVWTDKDGHVIATGKTADVELGAGLHKLTLTVTDSKGHTATDRINVEVVDHSRIKAQDDFSNGLSKWKIVDEGESGGVGADGKSSEWHITPDGKLIQTTDLKSRQLEWKGASNPDVWKDGWSPLGDGVNMLRRGTYALYQSPTALKWDNYAIEATFQTPDKDGLGFLFHYQDAKNYYKLELDANGTLDRSASNGAGSIFNLIRMHNGIEKILAQVPGKYEPGDAIRLRVEIVDGKIQAYLNGEALFPYPVEDHVLKSGTVALYSWANAGLTFDNFIVYDMPSQKQADISGNGVLVGTAGNDTIHGGVGDDIIQGLAGNDKLYGGAGKDAIIAGQGDDTVDGGAGDDTLIGNEGNDHLLGGAGNDHLNGGAGNDMLEGGVGSDTYVYRAGDGSDTIIEGAAEGDQDQLRFDDAKRSDVVIRRHGSDIILEVGGETITLKDQLAGKGAGIEVISFADGTSLVGNQIAAAAVNRDPAVTSAATATGDEDTKISGQIIAKDVDGDALTYAIKNGFGVKHGTLAIDAATGKWTYIAKANYNGADGFTAVVSDGHGGFVEQRVTLNVKPVNDAPIAVNDAATVGESESKVFDLAANDTDVDGDALSLTGFSVTGVTGINLTADAVKAAFAIKDGKLSFTPGTLFDSLHKGETAKVTLSYTVNDGHANATGHVTLTINGEGTAANVMLGTATSDVMIGTDGDDAITAYAGGDYVFGRDGADVIDGGAGNDYLYGGKGKDVLNGGEGHDVLFGGAGNDVLIGGKGNDILTGGAGADSFVFRKGFGHDTVTDFAAHGTGADHDVINLSKSAFADFAAVQEHLTDTALGVTLTLGDGSTLTLSHVTKASLSADDFHFSA